MTRADSAPFASAAIHAALRRLWRSRLTHSIAFNQQYFQLREIIGRARGLLQHIDQRGDHLLQAVNLLAQSMHFKLVCCDLLGQRQLGKIHADILAVILCKKCQSPLPGKGENPSKRIASFSNIYANKRSELFGACNLNRKTERDNFSALALYLIVLHQRILR